MPKEEMPSSPSQYEWFEILQRGIVNTHEDPSAIAGKKIVVN